MDAVNRYPTLYNQDLQKGHSKLISKECSRIFDLENEFKVSVPLSKHNIDIIKDHLVERRHPANKQNLMYPTSLHTMIAKDNTAQLQFDDRNGLRVIQTDSNSSTPKNEINEKSVHNDVPISLDDYRPFECSWLSDGCIQKSPKLKEATKSSGNVFGNNGLLLVEACLSQKYPEFNFCDIEKD